MSLVNNHKLHMIKQTSHPLTIDLCETTLTPL